MLVIGGPTAAGKTSAALAVASAWDAVVLSADAMQVYRGMDVGTAKATRAERAVVPHFGIDVRDPDEAFDAAAFLALADRVVADHPRVVVCGGTSLYLRVLIRGLVTTPPVDPALRSALQASGDLHGRLRAVDPVLAGRLHPNDRVRIVRGLEVALSGGPLLSELQAAHRQRPDRVDAVGLWLERPDLDERIDARTEQMFAAGYLDEVRGLLERGFDRSLKPMRSLGYRHLCDHLVDGLALAEAVRRTARDTRRFARKQRTWNRTLGFPVVADEHVSAALIAAERAFSNQ